MERLQRRFGLKRVASDNPSETARRWTFADGRGEIGIIAPVSEPFCGHCNRIRLTADGKIRTCLFSITEHDMRPLLRDGKTDADLAGWLRGVVWQKEARHHIGEPEFVPPPRSMRTGQAGGSILLTIISPAIPARSTSSHARAAPGASRRTSKAPRER